MQSRPRVNGPWLTVNGTIPAIMSLERQLNIKEGERVLAVERAAWVTVILPFLIASLFVLAPLFFTTPLLRIGTLGFIIIGTSEALGIFIAARVLVIWRGSVLAVTERRLIVVRRKGFFEREVVELPFARVHEVSYRVKGPFATLLGYGTLLVESAGSAEPICMDCVSSPARLQDLLTELQEASGRGAGDFGEMLQAVSQLDDARLKMLKSEIERTLASRGL